MSMTPLHGTDRDARWKWFFAYNGSFSTTYDEHIEIMVRSARANTSLDPHMIYCGPAGNPIIPVVERLGVKVIRRRPRILPELQRIKDRFPDYPIDTASGAYLRIDLPLICRELGYTDEFVLYTDCDVVFMRDIPAPEVEGYLRPELFACAPQTSQTNWADMNSGVMVMNVSKNLDEYEAFTRFITSGDTLYHDLWKGGAFDQKAYRLYYDPTRWDQLPLEYNWKPYWGMNARAFIVHFHGPKIPQVRDVFNGGTGYMQPDVRALYDSAPDAYGRYIRWFEAYGPASGQPLAHSASSQRATRT